jgi:hypothetical protein
MAFEYIKSKIKSHTERLASSPPIKFGIDFLSLKSNLLVDQVLSLDISKVKQFIVSQNLTITDLIILRRKVKSAFLRSQDKRDQVNILITEVIQEKRQILKQRRKISINEKEKHIGDLPVIDLPLCDNEQASYAAEQRMPLVDTLDLRPDSLRRFFIKMNGVIEKFKGTPITHIENYIYYTQYGKQNLLEITFRLSNNYISYSKHFDLRRFVSMMYTDKYSTKLPVMKTHEGFVLPRSKYIDSSFSLVRLKNALRMIFKPQRETMIAPRLANTHQKNVSPMSVRLRKRQLSFIQFPFAIIDAVVDKIKFNQDKQELVFTIDPQRWSEAEVAYMITQLSSIVSGSVNFFGNDRDLDKRRTIFLLTYNELLKDQFTPASRKQLIGLESQMKIIETHLITPLITGKGVPKPIGLIGPPGTGKTFTLRALMKEHSEIAFLPIQVSLFYQQASDGQPIFEKMIAKLQTLANKFHIPVVVIIDDAEGLFSETMTGNYTNTSGISSKNRQRILQILNGLGDTGFHVIFSFNHPEILDAAARRRMHLVVYGLPDIDQRRAILDSYISLNWLSGLGIIDANELKRVLIDKLANMTKGFNSSYLYEVVTYVKNYLGYDNRDSTTLTKNDIIDYFLRAIDEVRTQGNLDELKIAEEVAQSFVGNRRSIGFDLEER